ncbi:nuclear pore complex assembly-domain-containing protein [Pseudoneurospora amorphoporcata]|uniref:Nuclear pore complex assembly-domain-containing protein n=1 Tax=Pseudoneurospora amorphoporcata TaxID=241081 RepID=A0AAN6SGP2_9PEZI|nr:nuclear pore complex assembly-domain-containing protein [Pseudoneurospora amorphoporcata]
MADFTEYNNVFPSPRIINPYDHKGASAIETFRKSFRGVLFVDRVLSRLGISQGTAYPPKGENGLRSLHQQICQSSVSSHYKISLLYYLLLDHDDIHPGRSQWADGFAEEAGLPKKYQILMRGLWHMDRKEFKYAIENLAHPSLPTEFADEITIALVRLPLANKRSSSASQSDYTLALAYFHAAQPVFTSSEALELLFGALARTNVTEALDFSRRYPEWTRQQLFEKLLASILEQPEKLGARGKEFVSAALTAEEESWFQEYLRRGEGRKSKGSGVLLRMRGVVTGRLSSIAALENLLGP